MVSGGRIGLWTASAVVVIKSYPLWRSGSEAIRDGSVSPGEQRVLSDESSRELLMVPRLLPHRWHGARCGSQVPTVRKILRGGLHNELADDVGFRGAKLLDQVLQLGLCGLIQP
jgi:hypothetical protein